MKARIKVLCSPQTGKSEIYERDISYSISPGQMIIVWNYYFIVSYVMYDADHDILYVRTGESLYHADIENYISNYCTPDDMEEEMTFIDPGDFYTISSYPEQFDED